MSQRWKLEGFDVFSNEIYALPGEYKSELIAWAAAVDRLDELEKTQPSETSGGQDSDGIQDHVYIVRPDGSKYRFERSFLAVDCEVVVKETRTDLIVRTRDGDLLNLRTNLPKVRKGHRGKVLNLEGKAFFIREPYGPEDD